MNYSVSTKSIVLSAMFALIFGVAILAHAPAAEAGYSNGTCDSCSSHSYTPPVTNPGPYGCGTPYGTCGQTRPEPVYSRPTPVYTRPVYSQPTQAQTVVTQSVTVNVSQPTYTQPIYQPVTYPVYQPVTYPVYQPVTYPVYQTVQTPVYVPTPVTTPVYTPVPVPTPVYGNYELTVGCYADPSSAKIGQPVNWHVEATGGSGQYKVTWTGSENLSGHSNSLIKYYDIAGTKSAIATVESSDGQRVTQVCSNTVKVTAYAPVVKTVVKTVAVPVVQAPVVQEQSPMNTALQAAPVMSLANIPWGWVAFLVILVLFVTVMYLLFNRQKI